MVQLMTLHGDFRGHKGNAVIFFGDGVKNCNRFYENSESVMDSFFPERELRCELIQEVLKHLDDLMREDATIE